MSLATASRISAQSVKRVSKIELHQDAVFRIWGNGTTCRLNSCLSKSGYVYTKLNGEQLRQALHRISVLRPHRLLLCHRP